VQASKIVAFSWPISLKQESDRDVVILDQTILYPQGGGQPCDTGSIVSLDGTINFCVTDVRSKSGVVSFKSLPDVIASGLRVHHLQSEGTETFILRHEFVSVQSLT
jgi:Ser-tRNA(Ala) deacylase AlaX